MRLPYLKEHRPYHPTWMYYHFQGGFTGRAEVLILVRSLQLVNKTLGVDFEIGRKTVKLLAMLRSLQQSKRCSQDPTAITNGKYLYQ